jgi:beta-ring hydroxylase
VSRAIVPALHRRYITSMVNMFGDSTLHCISSLDRASMGFSRSVDMENYYSRLGLDIIGKAVFNYDFDSLSKDDDIIQAVYTTLREAEHRSLCPLPYWNLPGAKSIVPRQVCAPLPSHQSVWSLAVPRCVT